MKHFTLLFTAIAMSGCVFPSDIEDINTSLGKWQDKFTFEVAALQDTKAEQDRVVAELGQANEDLSGELTEIKSRSEVRFFELMRLIEQGASWAEIAAAIAAALGTGGVALNAYRNKTRKRDLDVVKPA